MLTYVHGGPVGNPVWTELANYYTLALPQFLQKKPHVGL